MAIAVSRRGATSRAGLEFNLLVILDLVVAVSIAFIVHPMPRARRGALYSTFSSCFTTSASDAARPSVSQYGRGMAARKVTITLDEELAAAASSAASAAGIPLSRLLARAAERELRRRAGLAAVAAWEADNGAFTPAEIAAVRAEMAAADDEYLRGAEKRA